MPGSSRSYRRTGTLFLRDRAGVFLRDMRFLGGALRRNKLARLAWGLVRELGGAGGQPSEALRSSILEMPETQG